ncbi:MAG TPA: class I SAM-dependent methyltransferase [Gaiellaceae bacterium]|nr:class I SAM-dependent methyltransferase [Gaiellaceae bacterium]
MEAALQRVLGHGDEADPQVVRALDLLNARYPVDLLEGLQQDAPRMVEHVTWVKGCKCVLDIGGGYGPFALLLNDLGAKAAVVDTFDHELFEREDLQILMTEFTVEMVNMDATAGAPLPFEDDSFDCVASFDSLEHWHHSPRRLFQEVRRVARPGALFVLGVPNAVNARKRLAVLAGKTNWSHFADWYEPDHFVGHVREPVVSDIEKMAEELGLEPRAIVGRNWLGSRRGPIGRAVTSIVDAPLRLRPSLCANLYLLGRLGERG